MKKGVLFCKFGFVLKVTLFLFLFGWQVSLGQTTADITVVSSQCSAKIVDPNLTLVVVIRNEGPSSVSTSQIVLNVVITESGQTTSDFLEANKAINTLGCPTSLNAGQSCTITRQYNLNFALTRNTWDPSKSWTLVVSASPASGINDPNTSNNSWVTTITSLDEALSLAKFLDVQLLNNPVTGIAQFHLEANKPMNVGINLLDMTGKTVLIVPEKPLAIGPHIWKVDVSSLPQGLYWYQITIDGYSVISSPLLKQ
jgi:hypothetical protein